MAGIILNGSVIKGLILNGSPVTAMLNGVKVFPTEEPTPSTTILYQNSNNIFNQTVYTKVDWNSHNFILIQRSLQYSGSNGTTIIDKSGLSNEMKFEISKLDSIFSSDKYAIRSYGWAANATIDNENVTTTTWANSTYYVIPVNPVNYCTDKIVIDTSNNILYYYVNGILMFHKTNLSDYKYTVAFEGGSFNVKDIYVVGCNTLEDAVNF